MSKPKEMADKVAKSTKAIKKPVKKSKPKPKTNKGGAIPVGGAIKVGGAISSGGAISVGGKVSANTSMLSNETIDQLEPHVFTHMLLNMDAPTYEMIRSIAANYLRMQHPLQRITKAALGGSFEMPKSLSRISMKDIYNARSPQHLANALHSEVNDWYDGKVNEQEFGGGLFSSLKTAVKKGINGSKRALKALGSGAAQAVRIFSAGAKAAGMHGKAINNTLKKGIEIANAISPVIQQVFPKTQGVLKAGLGHAEAASELLTHGINVSERVADKLKPAIDILGDINDPIVLPFEKGGSLKSGGTLPVGAGVDSMEAKVQGSDISGPLFVS